MPEWPQQVLKGETEGLRGVGILGLIYHSALSRSHPMIHWQTQNKPFTENIRTALLGTSLLQKVVELPCGQG